MYKRQVLAAAGNRLVTGGNDGFQPETLMQREEGHQRDDGGAVPVSYTHLDVYKRQPQNIHLNSIGADGFTWTGGASGMDNTPRGRDAGGYRRCV